MKLLVKDAARLLNVSEKAIYRWVKQGSIPAYRLRDQYRFNRAELLEWATSRRVSISPEIFREEEPESTQTADFSEAFRAGGICCHIGGEDKSSVLHNIVETLRLPVEVDRQFLYQVLLAREALGSTAIGDGIAIPHVRNPVILHLESPSITLCFLDHPVDLGALDGRPVDSLFTLISPTVRAHLHLLSRLSFALRDPRFREAVCGQVAPEEILTAAEDAERGGSEATART
jgi:nitrogen PTS system EIIA component